MAARLREYKWVTSLDLSDFPLSFMSKPTCNWHLTLNEKGERETVLEFKRKKYQKRKDRDAIYFVVRRYFKESEKTGYNRIAIETVFIHYDRDQIINFIRGQDISTGKYVETTQATKLLNLYQGSMVPDGNGGYEEVKA